MQNRKMIGAALVIASVLTVNLKSAGAVETGQSQSLMDTDQSSSGYIGALFGANFPNGGQGSDNSPNIAFTLGAKASPYAGVGIYGGYYGQSQSSTLFGLTTGSTIRTFNLLAEANGFYSIFHAGLDVGMSRRSWSVSAANESVDSSNTSLVYGPEGGFDFPLGQMAPHFSIGGEVHYLFSNESRKQDNLQALAALKIWL